MKLDSRIKSLSDILTCFDIEEAKQFIGQKGYFSDDFSLFKNLSCVFCTFLTEVIDDNYAFRTKEWEKGYGWRYQFFLPESRLIETKEKET